jgi:OFA family oxalate/formate antiporter-like MFS transporter
VFIAAATISIAAGLCAKFVLAPMRKRWIDNTVAATSVLEGAAFQANWPDAPHKSSAQ